MTQNIVVLLLIFNLGLISSSQIEQTNSHLCSQDHNTDCLESNADNVDSQFQNNIIQQKKCEQLDGVEACNEFDTSVSDQISQSNENNRNSDDHNEKYPNLELKKIISSDEQLNSNQNVPNKDQNYNEILKTDIKYQEQNLHKSHFQRGFKDSNLNKALLKHQKYLLHNYLLREYDLVVHNDLPFCSKSTTYLNNTNNNSKQIDFFEVTNLFSGFFNLEHAIVRYEQRNLNYKMKGEYFLPFFVELYPHFETILQKERGILRLFQEKQGGGDCILFLLNKDSCSYSSLPLSFDFHFEYVELKNKTDVNSLSNFQLSLRNAHRIAVLNTPTNLMLIDSLHCALHSFVLIGSFSPMTAYFHLGYAVCSLSLFEALFPHLAQGGAGEGEEVETLFLEYDFDEIAELSESRTNMNMNNEKKFTYQSVVQSKQIAGYLAVTVQDHIRDQHENILKKSKNLHQFQEKTQNKHEMSVFKLVSTFDVNSRLTLFNVQTLTDILNEPLESNGPVLAETFELADRLTKEQTKITQHKHYRLILDEKEGFCVLEKTGNVFILAFDLIRRTFYTVIKWVADHL